MYTFSISVLARLPVQSGHGDNVPSPRKEHYGSATLLLLLHWIVFEYLKIRFYQDFGTLLNNLYITVATLATVNSTLVN